MKVSYRLFLVQFALSLLICQACKKVEVPDLPSVPFVKTLEINSITGKGARCGGKITYEGEGTVTERGVCWSTDLDPSLEDNKTTDGDGAGIFTSILSDLEGATTYYVRAYATNSAGTGYGMTTSFKTLGGAPGAVTQVADNITINSAILNGTINANYLPTDVTFEYGTTTDYGIAIAVQPNSVLDLNFPVEANITGLIPNTTYRYRLKAVNSNGTTYGNDMSFKTLGGPPLALTRPAANITIYGVILNGTINANYLPTDVTFEYGTTTSYGMTIAVSPGTASLELDFPIQVNVSGLTPNTTYHFRVKAVNSSGTTYGNDLSFKTFPSGFPIDGLLAYFTFSGGQAFNFCNNGNHGVIYGASPSPDRISKPNESFHFNSEDDYIIVRNPNFIDNNVGTIATWVKFDNLDHIQYVASLGDTNSVNNYLAFIRLDNSSHTLGVFQKTASGNQNWVNGTSVISTGVYYHVVVTSDGLKWSIYINGVKDVLEVISGSNTGKWINSISGADNFVVGNVLLKKPYPDPYLSGNIDEVLIYNRALNESEVFNLYTLIFDK